jgi:hypothetical protein
MNSIDLNMKYVQANTESRVIRASWTREMAEDLNMYHGLEFEDELSQILKKELSKERCSKRKKSIDKIFKLQKTS